ncbi:MAG: D-alanyl-D-alanine carboxypeptidase [Eubacterium sp.]|nr:D-alanyl-D-alanine carboxypeptidase [Eubacterium sp.]
MKRTLSYILTVIVLFTSLFCVPFVSANAATYTPDRDIYAEAYMLINLDDDSYPVVAQKNIDERLYPASLTKIVTAMVVLNNVKDLQATTKMSQTAFDALLGSGAQVAGISVGEELTIDKLLYLAMVHSACDACEILAEYVSGSIDAFVAEMNKYVQSLGCKDTNFVNPDGLHDANHYTTARDVATITLAALKNADFVRYSTATEVEYKNMVLPHTNQMLHRGYITYYYEYAQGIKTGSTEEAEYCVVTKASKDGYNYLAVVLKSPRQKINGESYETKCSFVDAKSLFEWAFDSLKYTTLISENEVLSEITVEDGKDADSVQLVAKADANVIVPAALDKSAVIIQAVDKPEVLKAPVTKGQDVCKANVIYGDEVIATVELVAAKDIELSTFLKVINAIKAFFGSTAVKIAVVAIVLLVIVYIFLIMNNNKKKKKRRQQKINRGEKNENPPDDYLPPPQRRNW